MYYFLAFSSSFVFFLVLSLCVVCGVVVWLLGMPVRTRSQSSRDWRSATPYKYTQAHNLEPTRQRSSATSQRHNSNRHNSHGARQPKSIRLDCPARPDNDIDESVRYASYMHGKAASEHEPSTPGLICTHRGQRSRRLLKENGGCRHACTLVRKAFHGRFSSQAVMQLEQVCVSFRAPWLCGASCACWEVR